MYDPETYWIERGKTYEERFVRRAAHASQEEAILAALEGKGYRSILEVGCGFGRIGALLIKKVPVDYLGIDPSPDQAIAAAKRLGIDFTPEEEVSFRASTGWEVTRETRAGTRAIRCVSLEDFVAEPQAAADLVVAVEVLMHQPPETVGAFAETLRRQSRRYVLTADWDVPVAGRIAPWNFLHDYPSILGPVKRTAAGPRQGVYVGRGLAR